MKLSGALGLVLVALLALPGTGLAQKWTPLTNQPSFAANDALLLTDGTVLAQDTEGRDWWKLTPDVTGSYVNGTWSQVASLPSGYAPLYHAAAVLPDGRLMIQGGEYNISGRPVWTNQGAIYDPVKDTWTKVNAPAGWSRIGDAHSATNYPLVRITNNGTGHVFYARTHNHSAMGVATGSKPVSTTFDVPDGIETGASSLVVVANGMPSAAQAVTVN